MTAKFIITPGGEKLAILPADEYEDMRDALAHANGDGGLSRRPRRRR